MYIKKKGMMDVVNVLIADDNIHYARFLMNNINKNNKSIRVCYIAKDGKETINVINNLKNIDVILLDLQMPIYNGIEVIEKINDKDRYKKSCIVISGDIDLVGKLSKNNIVYSVIMKTNNIDTIILQINSLIKSKEEEKNKKKIKNMIINELLYLGFDISHKGTQYLIKTIEYIFLNSDKDLEKLEKYVYPKIAIQYDNSVHNIKCNINRANNAMYYECEIEKLKRYFKFDRDTKPKVKTVINTIINKIS